MPLHLSPAKSLVSTSLIAATVLLAGCTGGTAATTTTTTASPAATASSAESGTPTETGTPTASPSVRTVNANTASTDEIAAALKDAGVQNSDRWAKEVEEYRLYTADNLRTKLSTELGKYGVSADQLDKILSTLTV